MVRHGKMVALICALSMLVSMFTGFTVVNAADVTKGYVLEVDDVNSTELEKVINVKAVGVSEEYKGGNFKLALPEDLVETATADLKVNAMGVVNYTGGELIVPFVSAQALTLTDGLIATVKVTLKAALTEDLDVAFTDAKIIEGKTQMTLVNGDIQCEGTTLAAPVVEPTDPPAETPIPPVEVTKGYELEYDAEASTDLQKVIKVKAVGVTEEYKGGNFKLAISEEIAADAKAELKVSAMGVVNYTGGELIVPFVSAQALTLTDGLVAVVTIDLKSELTKDLYVGFNDAKVIEGKSQMTLVDGQIQCNGVYVPAPVKETPTPDPDATATPEVTVAPTAIPRPTAVPTATPEATEPPVDPTETPEPTIPPVEVTKGYELEYDAEASTDLQKVIKVKAVGVTEEYKGGNFKLAISEEIAADAKAELKVSAMGVVNYTGGELIVPFVSAQALTLTDGLVAVVTIDLKSELTKDLYVGFNDAKVIEGKSQMTLVDGQIQCNGVYVPAPVAETPIPTETPEPEETPEPTEAPETLDTIALGSLVDADKAAAIEEANPATPSNAYVTIETNGVYGTDYVAKIGDTVLTEAEFINKISGYDGSVADAIRNIDLVVYTDGTTIKADLNDATTNTIVDSGEQTVTKATPAPQKVPTIKWSKTSVTVTVNKTVSASVTVKNQPEDYTIEYEIEDGDTYIDFEVNEKDQKKITIEGNKVGTAYIVAVLKDADGNVVAEAGKLKVNVKKAGTTSSGSSSSGAGSIGTIAGSQQPTGNGGLWRPDSNVAVSFTDLGQAAWAADAINYLAARGIVNGRSATIFDPNASITRAEFTKLVLTVYGITPPADAFTASSYSDVNISAWYGSYIEAGSMLGIVTGYPDGTFRPDALVSRQEMAVMMYRAANTRGTVLPVVNAATAWADAAMIGDWAAEAVTALNVAGIMNGTSATTFEPTAAATRAQAAQMIYNLYTVTQ